MKNVLNPRSRKALIVLALVVITAIAGLAIDRSVEASIIDAATARLAAVGEYFAANRPASESSVNSKKPDDLGIGTDKLIFGQYSSGATDDFTRVDKLKIFDPVTQGLTDLGSVDDFDPALSPDGTKIVFVSNRDLPYTTQWNSGQYQNLYIMNADGSSQTRLSTTGFSGGAYTPAFSPDGNNVVFYGESPDGDTRGLYVTRVTPGTGMGTATLLTDGTGCPASPVHKSSHPRKRGNGLAPIAYYYLSTPNYSPDGQYIIFGMHDANTDNWDIFRVDAATGGNCVKIYTDDSNSRFDPQARYSPDGTKIALVRGYEIFGGYVNDRVEKLRIVDPTDGTYTEFGPTDIWSTPVWVDNNKVAFFQAGRDNNNSLIPNRDVQAIDLTTQQVETLYSGTLFDGLHGLAIGAPSTVVPAVSMRITGNNPVMGGSSTAATLKLRDPAPAGGITFNVDVTDIAIGEVTVPQATYTIPEGQTEVVIPVNTLVRNEDGVTARIFAHIDAPYYLSASATVSLRRTTPDLRASTLNAPAAVAPDSPFNLDWSVDNIGLGSTGPDGGWDTVYFSEDNVLDTNVDIAYVAQVTNLALAAGATRTISTTAAYGIPSSVVPGSGDYFLILATNSMNTVDEGGQSANNILVRPIHVDLPDLVPENLTAPPTVNPGVNYTLNWTLRNAGSVDNGVATVTRIYFSPNTTPNDGDEVQLGFIDNGVVVAGQTYPQSATVSIPTLPVRPDGPGLLYVKVDANNVVNEGTAGEANNTAPALTTFEYRVPDLQVTASSVASEVETDTPFALSWTTANTGNKATGNFDEQVYFSTDNQVGGDTLLGTFPLTGGLAAGASADRIQSNDRHRPDPVERQLLRLHKDRFLQHPG